MKKNVLILLSIITIVSSLFAKSEKIEFNLEYDMPEFANENAYTFDARAINSLGVKNYEMMFNSMAANSFDIYGNAPDSKEWVLLTRLKMHGFGDCADSKSEVKESTGYRYFSVVPLRAVKYIYNIRSNGKKIKIEVRDKDDDFEKPALPKMGIKGSRVFNIKKYNAEDYCVFINQSAKANLSVVTYYFDEKEFKWVEAYQSAKMNGFGSSAKIEIVQGKDFDFVKYMGFDVSPAGNYNFRIYNNKDDLYVEISDPVSR